MSDDDMFADLLEEQNIDNPSPNSDGSTPLEFSGVASPAAAPTQPRVPDEVPGSASKGFICPICSQQLKKKPSLTRHVFLHTINGKYFFEMFLFFS